MYKIEYPNKDKTREIIYNIILYTLNDYSDQMCYMR